MAKSVGIIGSGAAGLATAHILLCDGFDVTVLTRDSSPGGVWSKDRIYPDLLINNVHGEYRFSALPMPERPDIEATGGRLSGEDMRLYMENYTDSFLPKNIRYNVEVINIRRIIPGASQTDTSRWVVTISNTIGNKNSSTQDQLTFDKIVLCTGGSSQAFVPKNLSPAAASDGAFDGMVIHSSEFGPRLMDFLAATAPDSQENPRDVVVIGGGKSAMDIASYLTNQGRRVSVVFETTDMFLASPIPLPGFIRRSRLLSIMSPHIDLRSRLEHFLHTSWLGSKIVHSFWDILAWTCFLSLSIPKKSPLRRTHPFFWGVRINDEGAGRTNGFYDLVNKGKINLVAPARAISFGTNRKSVVLNDGRILKTDAVVLATGFKSSWDNIFDQATKDDLGLGKHAPMETAESKNYHWSYTSLKNPPPARPENQQWASSLYRGLVPAKNILHKDFAVNGALYSTNNGFMFETSAHWISSYFLGDKFLRVPSSPEEAFLSTEREAAFLRKRHPDMVLWTNESYGGAIKFFNWPQHIDELLDDMGLPCFRSGGSWLTWPFKVMDLREIFSLGVEREAKRAALRAD